MAKLIAVPDEVFQYIADTYLHGTRFLNEVIREAMEKFGIRMHPSVLFKKLHKHPIYLDDPLPWRLADRRARGWKDPQASYESAHANANGLFDTDRSDCTLFWSREKLIQKGYLRADKTSTPNK